MRSSMRFDPARDWLMLVTLSGIALAGIIVWNVWTFDTVASGGVVGGETIPSPPLINPESINAIRTVFAARAAEEAKYATGVYQFSDPSQ